MVTLIRYLKITRPLNLVIVAFLQLVMYYKILLPVYRVYDVTSIFGSYLFPLFVLVTVIIAASGNVINDILDIEIDKVNKPKKWIVGNVISRDKAYGFYYLLLTIGGIFSFVIAYLIDRYYYLLLYVCAVYFLYLYSKYLKKVLILGNVLVSVFTAGVIGIILIFEFESGSMLKSISIYQYEYIGEVFIGFMIFSFLTSVYREIVKDIEDLNGDKVEKSMTIPLVFGVKKAKYIAVFLSLLIFISLVFWINMEINEDKIYFKIYACFVVIPFLLTTMYLLVKANKKNEFSRLSKMIKSFMIIGILMLWFYFFK